MKKTVFAILSVICTMIILAGCVATTSSSKAYIFSVDNGDKVKVQLDTSGNYDLSSNVPFAISCNGNILSEGAFVLGETYAQYVAAVDGDENAILIDSGKKDENEYIFWSYNGTEFNYAILVADSSTAIILGNAISEESAKECFSRLTISIDE